jgi:hypothetical protein
MAAFNASRGRVGAPSLRIRPESGRLIKLLSRERWTRQID